MPINANQSTVIDWSIDFPIIDCSGPAYYKLKYKAAAF